MSQHEHLLGDFNPAAAAAERKIRPLLELVFVVERCVSNKRKSSLRRKMGKHKHI